MYKNKPPIYRRLILFLPKIVPDNYKKVLSASVCFGLTIRVAYIAGAGLYIPAVNFRF